VKKLGRRGVAENAEGADPREEIIREFLPFIKYTASRLAWRMPPQMTVDDLVSSGLIGLMDALGRYQEGRVRLRTYAEFRIRGAMLDELRAADWTPRSLKKRVNEVRSFQGRLQKELGRPPEDEEVAEAMQMSLDEYYRTLGEANGAVSYRFEDFDGCGDSGEGLNILKCIPDAGAQDPLDLLQTRQQTEGLARLIGEMSEKEQLLLSLYYWEELTMKEIGRIMKLTEGRVSQIHSQALSKLRAAMKAGEKCGQYAVEQL